MTQETKEKSEQFDEFFDMIAPSLKLRVQQNYFYQKLITNKCINKIAVQLRAKYFKDKRKGIIRRIQKANNPWDQIESMNLNSDDYIYDMVFVSTINGLMSTLFTSPEEVVVKQGQSERLLFFIIQGDCSVNMVDHQQKEHIATKLLVDGNHFGEIGLIYKTERTATVISRNYNTIGCLNENGIRTIRSNYPEFITEFKKQVYRYNDAKKLYMYHILINKVEYFSDIDIETFHQLIYSFEYIVLG